MWEDRHIERKTDILTLWWPMPFIFFWTWKSTPQLGPAPVLLRYNTSINQGRMKYSALWEPHLVGQYFAQVFKRFTSSLLLHVTRNSFLSVKFIFNQRRIFHATINYVLPQEIISYHKTLFAVPRNYLLNIDYKFCK